MVNKYNISFITPSIRTHLWEDYYNSIKESCTKYSWEIIFITPFETNFKRDNVKIIRSYRSPTGCFYEGLEVAEGTLINNSVDDTLYELRSIDKCIDTFDYNNIMNFRYSESVDRKDPPFDLSYWKAWTHPALRLKGVPMNYDITLHFTLTKDLFYRLGGIDPRYNYVNFGTHDFIFRSQFNGIKIINSPVNVSKADHMPGNTGDHAAINTCDQIDYELFKEHYNSLESLATRSKFNFTKQYLFLPQRWDIRFNKQKLPNNYEEL